MKISGLFNNILIKNLFFAIVLLLIIVFGVLAWLNSYTRHGKQVEIPDVRGLQMAEAAAFFEQRSLRYEVIDSIFVKNKKPGSILETAPPVGTHVKEGRTIYITLNAHTARMLLVPVVKDMSQRQALAMLNSLGFDNVEVKLVSGPYKDLVLGLEARGKEVEPGARMEADVPLYLLVSLGDREVVAEEDTLQEFTPDESWF